MMHIYNNIMFNYIPGFKSNKMTEIRGILNIRVVNSGPGILATKKKTAPG